MEDRGRENPGVSRPLGERPARPARGRREEGAKRVREILPGLFERLGITKEVASQDALGAWESIVGPHIAEVTRATAVANGVLFVNVRSSAWLSELNMMKHEFLRRLNAGRGEGRIDRIVLRLEDG